MHILLLDLGNEMRGGQWQVFYLARALAKSSNFKPILACPKNSPLGRQAAEIDGLRIVRLNSSRDWDPINFHILRRVIKQEQIDIVHTHCAKSASLGAACKKLRKDTFKLVHSRRVSYPLKKKWSGAKYHLADAVVAVSSEIAGVITSSGLPAESVSVIHSGIDSSRYPQRHSRGDSRYVIGMIGAMTEQKGHKVFLHALAELKKMGGIPQWEARIIGSGPLFQELMELAEELGIASHIAMLGWQDAPQFLSGFDVLAVPSVNGEGSSGTLKEGWASGLPVVCSDLPSNLELITNFKNGLTFPNRDHIQLARHLKTLANDNELYMKLAEAGFASADSFSAQRMADDYMALYKRL